MLKFYVLWWMVFLRKYTHVHISLLEKFIYLFFLAWRKKQTKSWHTCIWPPTFWDHDLQCVAIGQGITSTNSTDNMFTLFLSTSVWGYLQEINIVQRQKKKKSKAYNITTSTTAQSRSIIMMQTFKVEK